jgi:hypothetical protein
MTDNRLVSFSEFEAGNDKQNTQDTIAAYSGYLAAHQASIVATPAHPLSPDFIVMQRSVAISEGVK